MAPLHAWVGLAVINAWNFPNATASWKIAPALCYGNAVVWKPANVTPASAVALAEIIDRQDIPKGLFSLIMGAGRSVGQRMVESPKVNATTSQARCQWPRVLRRPRSTIPDLASPRASWRHRWHGPYISGATPKPELQPSTRPPLARIITCRLGACSWCISPRGFLLIAGKTNRDSDPMEALKSAMIIGALPFTVVMTLMCVALTKTLYRDGLREKHAAAKSGE
ncbi:MAG: hypothetical protein ACI8R4_000713 [Paracoccaceae bacterium]|jgi:hypothetical protein